MQKIWIVFLTLLAFASSSHAQEVTIYPSDIKYIYDGDTFYIHCRDDLRCENGKLGVRLAEIDTPELKGKCRAEKELSRQAKKVAVEFLRTAESILLTIDDKRPYGYYGRLIASVSVAGQDLGELLISKQVARPYAGGRKLWCDTPM